uniref:Uncharacterized protein n=1 Tax=Candidozyma auris TaxID=498019 RepID=A0A0L0NQJ3_CANAR
MPRNASATTQTRIKKVAVFSSGVVSVALDKNIALNEEHSCESVAFHVRSFILKRFLHFLKESNEKKVGRQPHAVGTLLVAVGISERRNTMVNA